MEHNISYTFREIVNLKKLFRYLLSSWEFRAERLFLSGQIVKNIGLSFKNIFTWQSYQSFATQDQPFTHIFFTKGLNWE